MCGILLDAPSPLGGRPRVYCSNRCKQEAKWKRWRAEHRGFVSNLTVISRENAHD